MYLTPESFITNLKRAAKIEKRAQNQHNHTFFLDKIASVSGYKNWALLHKNLDKVRFGGPQFREIRKIVNSRLVKAVPNAIQEYVISDLRSYLKGNFEKLAEFSMPDSSSTNGFSHPSIDLTASITENFSDIYPESLLQVAIDVLEKEGPWCMDDGDIYFEEFGLSDW
ncbi:hypothetical protein CXF72_01385 [Psychromonas sp. MB-3u-54]|uniref:hypothetical protein n=1 Tax=Psychromonas sp. MB-3u-54 TaxID=2058319 RepID=UPI000C34A7F1|nr:hypothetical protein [Psychromonas sp. MB-3u-54]PKH04422.1 hypothetical protein CXF72_01385 [Psychromonas sp. MB-3u-54]